MKIGKTIDGGICADYGSVNEISEYGGSKGETELNGKGPNNMTSNQEVLVRSAIKYWVERHKHIVKYGPTICIVLFFFFDYRENLEEKITAIKNSKYH